MKCFLLLLLFLSIELHHLGDPSDCPPCLSNYFNLQSVWVSVSHKNGKELQTHPPPPQKKKKKKKKKLRYLGANIYESVGVIFVFVLKNQQGGPRGRVGKVAEFQRS